VFYQNMTQTAPNDLVISYAGAEIKAIGRVTQGATEARKPAEFGNAGENWENAGWLVKVWWMNLPVPMRPKEIWGEISHLFPDKYSPLNSTGNGNQVCYLAEVSEELMLEIVRLAAPRNPELSTLVTIDAPDATEPDAMEKDIEEIRRGDAPETEKAQLIKARKGQGEFRSKVTAIEKKCRVTGVKDASLLIASHIKPWRESTNEERLDGNNGLLLSPHVDKLFDRNLVSFSDVGRIIVYSSKARSAMEAWGIDEGKIYGSFNQVQKNYLSHHREMCARIFGEPK
jgi:hypothetical protein